MGCFLGKDKSGATSVPSEGLNLMKSAPTALMGGGLAEMLTKDNVLTKLAAAKLGCDQSMIDTCIQFITKNVGGSAGHPLLEGMKKIGFGKESDKIKADIVKDDKEK